MNEDYLVRQEDLNREEAKLARQRNTDRLADALNEMDRDEENYFLNDNNNFDHVVMGEI